MLLNEAEIDKKTSYYGLKSKVYSMKSVITKSLSKTQYVYSDSKLIATL